MEICRELDEYQKWYEREMIPQLRKLAAHVKDCPRCQELLMREKDDAALKMLLATEGDMLK